MRFRNVGAAMALVASLSLAVSPAFADGYTVRDGQGALQTFGSKLLSGVQYPIHLLFGLFGSTPTPIATDASGNVGVNVQSSALPTGAASAAGQATTNGSLSSIDGKTPALGATTKAASVPVTFPTDPDTRSGTATITAADVASTTVSGQGSVTLVTGVPTANSSVSWALNGASSVTIGVSGTFVETANVESSADCFIYGPTSAKILGSGAVTGTVTAPGIFRVDASGMCSVRLRVPSGGFTSGTLTTQANASGASGLTQVLNPIRLSDASGGVMGVSGAPLFSKSVDGDVVTLGALADAACGTDNGTCTVEAVLKRVAQRLTTINTTLGTPFQAGGALGAGSAIIGKVSTDLTTPGTTNNVAASSIQASVVVTPTVTAASAYASGNAVGGLQTLTSAVRVSGSTALLQKVVLNFKSSQTAQTDVLIFSASPASTTVTDKTAFSLNTADFDKLVGVVHISDCTNAGTASMCQANNLAMSLKAVGTANLFAVLVTRGTPTFTATTDVSVNFVFIQD